MADDSGKPGIDTQDTVQSDRPSKDVPAPLSLSSITITGEAKDRYRLVDSRHGKPTDDVEKALLARGGMGRILCVLDTHTGREIVLKERIPEKEEGDRPRSFTPDCPSPYDARFLYEARITAQLEHPYIVPVYEIGQREDGRLYYTMRKVRGKTLTAALAECETLAERLEYLPHFLNLCNAVAYAQSRGIIHRDLKPQNVMVSDFGETLVLDWGLAKISGSPEDSRDMDMKKSLESLKGDSAQTLAGQAVGTPAYMPPEQADGDVAKMDERSDVYSLGAVLYEILTGRPPFKAASFPEMMANVFFKEPDRVRSIEGRVPAELADIAHTALSKDRDLRYLNAAEMAREVGSYLAGRFVPPQRRSPKAWLAYLWREKKRPLIAALAFVLIAAAGTAFHVQRTRALERRLSDAETMGKDLEALFVEEKSQGTKLAARLLLESEGARMSAGTAIGLTLAAFAVSMEDSRDFRLRLYREATARPYGVPRAVFHSKPPCTLALAGTDVTCVQPAAGSDGPRTWVVDTTGKAGLVESGERAALTQAAPGLATLAACAEGSGPSISATRRGDGGTLVVTCCKDGSFEVGTLAGTAYTPGTRATPGLALKPTSMDLSIDGKTLCLGTADGLVVTIAVSDVASGPFRAVAGHTGEVLSVLATGDSVVTSGRDGQIKVWPVSQMERLGPPLVYWTTIEGNPLDVDRSGRILVSRGGDLVLVDPATMLVEATVKSAGDMPSRLSPGGSIVSLLPGNMISVTPQDEGKAAEWPSPLRGTTSIWTQATARGEKIVLSGETGEVAILDPATGLQSVDGFRWGSGGVRDVILDPSEVNAAVLYSDGSVYLGGLGGSVKPWKPPVPPMSAIASTQDGLWVVMVDRSGSLWAAPFSGNGDVRRPCGGKGGEKDPIAGGTAPASCLVPTGTGDIMAMSLLGSGELLIVGPAGFTLYDVSTGRPLIGIPVVGKDDAMPFIDGAMVDRYGQVLMAARAGASGVEVSVWPVGGGWLTDPPAEIMKRVEKATGWTVEDWELVPASIAEP